jgi:hypothetical protein
MWGRDKGGGKPLARRDNPLEIDVEEFVSALGKAEGDMGEYARDVKPAFSVELTEDEELAIYESPSLAFPGTPMLNAQAAQALLDMNGPEWYVSFVERAERTKLKKAMDLPKNEMSTAL